MMYLLHAVNNTIVYINMDKITQIKYEGVDGAYFKKITILYDNGKEFRISANKDKHLADVYVDDEKIKEIFDELINMGLKA